MSSNEVDIVIKNGQILTMDEKYTAFNPGYVLIKDSEIIDIGSMNEYHSKKLSKIDSKEVLDAKSDIVLPGFVNAHGHFSMTLFRGIADDLPLKKWLNEYIWPLESLLTKEDCVIGAQLAAIEMIKGGTTTACDMYFNEKDILIALEKIGFRGILGYGMLDFSNEEKRKKELKITEELIKFADKNAKLCRIIVSPHAPNTCSPEIMREAKRLSENHDLPIQIHLSETKTEVEEIKAKTGFSPPKYLESIDFLSDNLVAAHCVWLSKEDIALLRKHNVKIAHNPSSNLKLGSGIMNYKAMTDLGLTIAIGTDGAASNNNLSMLNELRLASYLHKGNNLSPNILPAKQALRMATTNGAKALGVYHKVGSLEVGKKADIILVSKQEPCVWPPHDPYSLIAFAAQDHNIRTTIIEGKILMKNRKFTTVDQQEVMEKAKDSILDLLNRAKLEQYKQNIDYLQ